MSWTSSTSVCLASVYEAYGVKRVETGRTGCRARGRRRTRRVGGGGKWSRRMSDYCLAVAAEYEEKALYDADAAPDLTAHVCGEPRATAALNPARAATASARSCSLIRPVSPVIAP